MFRVTVVRILTYCYDLRRVKCVKVLKGCTLYIIKDKMEN